MQNRLADIIAYALCNNVLRIVLHRGHNRMRHRANNNIVASCIARIIIRHAQGALTHSTYINLFYSFKI